MITITADEIVQLHHAIILQSGGIDGIKDRGLIESAAAQPRMSFDGQDLYPSLAEKAAALGYSLGRNHGFTDGNKRIAHAALEVFLVLNGWEIQASVDEQEDVYLQLAAKTLTRVEFTNWVITHTSPLGTSDGS